MFKFAKITLPILAVFVFMGLFAASAFAAGPAPKIVIPVEKTFYLTDGLYQAIDAPTACAAGYHFASFWEIWDFSNFSYNTDLGNILVDDQGAGPPSSIVGWVRTGKISDHHGNCDNWTDNSSDGDGMTVNLSLGGFLDFNQPWEMNFLGCNSELHVWCLSDSVY